MQAACFRKQRGERSGRLKMSWQRRCFFLWRLCFFATVWRIKLKGKDHAFSSTHTRDCGYLRFIPKRSKQIAVEGVPLCSWSFYPFSAFWPIICPRAAWFTFISINKLGLVNLHPGQNPAVPSSPNAQQTLQYELHGLSAPAMQNWSKDLYSRIQVQFLVCEDSWYLFPTAKRIQKEYQWAHQIFQWGKSEPDKTDCPRDDRIARTLSMLNRSIVNCL